MNLTELIEKKSEAYRASEKQVERYHATLSDSQYYTPKYWEKIRELKAGVEAAREKISDYIDMNIIRALGLTQSAAEIVGELRENSEDYAPVLILHDEVVVGNAKNLEESLSPDLFRDGGMASRNLKLGDTLFVYPADEGRNIWYVSTSIERADDGPDSIGGSGYSKVD